MNLDISKISKLGWSSIENSKDSIQRATLEIYSELI